jgi:multiple sugar transport system permease protein
MSADKPRVTGASLLGYMLLALISLLFTAPLLVMIVGSFKPDAAVLTQAGSLRAFWPDQVSWQNYLDVFERVDFSGYFFNSIIITATIVALGAVINALAGYALARLHWRGRELLFALTLSIMIIPLEAIAVPLFYQVTLLGWRDTYVVQIIPFVANAFSIYLFHTFFLTLPKELEEAARIDGAGILRTADGATACCDPQTGLAITGSGGLM